MSIRYFPKWLKDEEKSYVEYRGKPWAWLDANISDPPPGVIYLKPRGDTNNFELSDATLYTNDLVDGGSFQFLVKRSTIYVFDYTPLILLILGIITNAFQLSICCRFRKRLPAAAFFATIAVADLSVWLVPLALCELWRPASRIILYALVMAVIVNLHNLASRGWQVQGTFGTEAIINNCGYPFPDARIFWLHVHPIVSVIINILGPAIASVLLILTLTAQGKCYPVNTKPLKSSTKRSQEPTRRLRINLLVVISFLSFVQTILLTPTAILSTMELFLEQNVHPSMRAFVLFGQLLNCVVKPVVMILAAPKLCSAISESEMNIYGEKSAKKTANKSTRISLETYSGDSEFSGHEEQSSLMKSRRKKSTPKKPDSLALPPIETAGKQLAVHHQTTLNRSRLIHATPIPPQTLPLKQNGNCDAFFMANTLNKKAAYSTNQYNNNHYNHNSQLQQPSASIISSHYPTLNVPTRNQSVTAYNHHNASLVTAAANALAANSTSQQPQQLYWRTATAQEGESGRKIYV